MHSYSSTMTKLTIDNNIADRKQIRVNNLNQVKNGIYLVFVLRASDILPYTNSPSRMKYKQIQYLKN